jgi:hypothetical protein
MSSKKYSFAAVLLMFLFLIGGFALFLEMKIYRNTLIVWTIPTAICIFSGILTTPFTFTILKKHFRDSEIIFLTLFNIVAFGSILSYVFMALNFYFPINQENVYLVKIINTGKLAKWRRGCRKPYADVSVKGKDKRLIFPCGFEVENYSDVILTVKSGRLGFDIITKKTFRTNHRRQKTSVL